MAPLGLKSFGLEWLSVLPEPKHYLVNTDILNTEPLWHRPITTRQQEVKTRLSVQTTRRTHYDLFRTRHSTWDRLLLMWDFAGKTCYLWRPKQWLWIVHRLDLENANYNNYMCLLVWLLWCRRDTWYFRYLPHKLPVQGSRGTCAVSCSLTDVVQPIALLWWLQLACPLSVFSLIKTSYFQ